MSHDTADRIDNDERMVVDCSTARHRLTKAYEGIDRLAATLSRDDLLEFSRCRGWVVADVLFHVLCDAQRALIALASPHPGPSDRDFVSYWRGFAADRDPIRRCMVDQAVGRLAVADFLTTLATEAAIHHLDMTLNLPAAPAPDPEALAAAVDTLDGLARFVEPATVNDARSGRPPGWSAEEYVLKATGRIPLTPDEVAATMGYPLLS